MHAPLQYLFSDGQVGRKFSEERIGSAIHLMMAASSNESKSREESNVHGTVQQIASQADKGFIFDELRFAPICFFWPAKELSFSKRASKKLKKISN